MDARTRRQIWEALLRQYWLFSIVGAVIIGVTLPTLLILWHTKFLTVTGRGTPPALAFPHVLVISLALEAAATAFCGPGAVFLGLLLYAGLSGGPKNPPLPARKSIKQGAIWGAGIAFLNLPGYLVLVVLDMNTPMGWLQLVLLFVVSGASCGMWIGWQAFRSDHPDASVFPQYSLKALMALVISWGVLLAVFNPG